jgi:hypothetical protein
LQLNDKNLRVEERSEDGWPPPHAFLACNLCARLNIVRGSFADGYCKLSACATLLVPKAKFGLARSASTST